MTDDIQSNVPSTITTKANDEIQPNPYLPYLGYINHTDVTEEFFIQSRGRKRYCE